MAVISPTDMPVVMTIAGSDSGGGAGIQADLKAFAAHGVHGASSVTAITAQNTLGVTAVQEIDLEVISAQIDAVVTDLEPVAVKTGMLSSPDIVRLVADKAGQYEWRILVVDPVMVASSGARLLKDEAIETYRSELLPLATVTTPNLPEATELSGIEISTTSEAKDAARKIHDLGVDFVIVKGGHMESLDESGDSMDLLFDGSYFTEFGLPWLDSTNNHGTGCTFASSITARLAKGESIGDAFKGAKEFVWNAMRTAPDIGQGNGPLNHMWQFNSK